MASATERVARGHGAIERRSYHFEEAGRSMEYAIFVPTGYRREAAAPVVILLHGLFSNPHQVIRYRGLTREAEKRGYIVVAPFGYSDRGWYGSLGWRNSNASPEHAGELSERDVLNVLAVVRRDFHVDSQRIYLMGHSMGGAGTLHLGASYPELWAALVPLSPPVLLAWDAMLEQVGRMLELPVMVVTGEKDNITPVQPVRELVAAMQELGMDCRYHEMQGSGHAAPALRPKLMAEIFDFFEACRRAVPAPQECTPPSAAEAGRRGWQPQHKQQERLEAEQEEEQRQPPSSGAKPSEDSPPHNGQSQVKFRQQGNRKWLRRTFTVLGHLQSGHLKLELAGW
eukprot:CAMPEP_0183436388 /NCGR_PEP_ID=MMETSP0370-20130417/69240_1 /TAXON_ID=268820 /ORGANISM="Peridinium aciculiferum, Strain PAER-2" /LENGTH=340 /DNA_ID=CAMNT_0025623815 /DNA_START=50 /DNA_END=1069 /DNA_ORIENTATION=+